MADAEGADVAFEALQNEVEFYRKHQSEVEGEIKLLIADNQRLSQQVEVLLKEKLDNARIEDISNQATTAEELRNQVTLLTKERDSLHVLWQTSQKTIDALETELQTYEGYEGRGHQNIIEEKRDLQLKLESALTDYVEIENQQKQVLANNKTLENNLKIKENELKNFKEREKELELNLAEVSKLLEGLRIDLAAEKRSNEDLRSQLTVCQKECVNAVKKEAEAKSKVAEALQLFDLVSGQKNEAYKKISEMAVQLSEVKRSQSEMERATESRLKQEVEELRQQYNEKVSDMLAHIRNLDAELVEKGVMLNKFLRENKILQAANDSYLQQREEISKSIDPKLQLAEQRLEAMYQELISSERRSIQLMCDKQSLTMDIQRQQDLYTRECKRRDWEEKLLKSERDEVKLRVEHLQKSLEDTHAMVNKLQDNLSSRSAINERIVSTKEDELLEMNKHLESQMELNKKWKLSYVDMTEKLKKRLYDLYEDNKQLRIKLKMPIKESLTTSSNIENDSSS